MSYSHPEVEVQVQVREGMGSRVSQYARDKVTAALQHTAKPVLYARVRLDEVPNPSAVHPVTARADVDVNGRLVHAEASGDTAYEAVDLLQDRLRARIEHHH